MQKKSAAELLALVFLEGVRRDKWQTSLFQSQMGAPGPQRSFHASLTLTQNPALFQELSLRELDRQVLVPTLLFQPFPYLVLVVRPKTLKAQVCSLPII